VATPADADRIAAALAASGLAPVTSVDLIGDAVVVRALPGTLEAVRAVARGVTVVEDPTADAVIKLAVCTDRNSCGIPLRGGITIYPGHAGR